MIKDAQEAREIVYGGKRQVDGVVGNILAAVERAAHKGEVQTVVHYRDFGTPEGWIDQPRYHELMHDVVQTLEAKGFHVEPVVPEDLEMTPDGRLPSSMMVCWSVHGPAPAEEDAPKMQIRRIDLTSPMARALVEAAGIKDELSPEIRNKLFPEEEPKH